MAGGSIFAVIVADFAYIASGWAPLSRASVDDRFSVFSILALTFVVAALAKAGPGLIGSAAVLSKQGSPSVHASMLACGVKRQLQPANVAASAPMRIDLMLSSLEDGVPLAVLAASKVLRWSTISCAKKLNAN